MERFYFKNVLINIWRNKLQSLGIFLAMFFLVFFLSVVHAYEYNETVENEIAKSMNLSIKVDEEHVFSSNLDSQKYYLKRNVNYESFSIYYDWIIENGQKKDFKNYHYLITFPIYENDERLSTINGYNDEKYFLNNSRSLIEGRFLTQDELDTGVHYVIVSEGTKAYVDGQIKTLQLNDKINFSKLVTKNEVRYSQLEVVVIGIVQSRIENNGVYTEENKIGEKNGIFMSSKIIESLIFDNADVISFERINIDEVSLYIDDYKEYTSLKEEITFSLNNLVNTFNDLNITEKLPYIAQTNEEKILESIKRIKTIYYYIYLLLVFLTISLLCILLFNLTKKKTNEIKIYKLLGQNVINIVNHYFIGYFIIFLLSFCCGVIVSNFICDLMIQKMIVNNFELQQELLKYTDIFYQSNNYLQLYELKTNEILRIFLESLVLLSTSSYLILIYVVKKTKMIN